MSGGRIAGSDRTRPTPALRRSKPGATVHASCVRTIRAELIWPVHRPGARCARFVSLSLTSAAYVQTTFLFVKLLQSFASVALAPDAQPAGSYIDDDPDQGLLPQAPVITLKLKGGIWARLERSDG